MAATDILLDENYDLLIKNGDFVVGESDYQHVELILAASKGSFRQHPILGVDITQFVNSPVTLAEVQRFKKEVGIQLSGDNYQKIAISMTDFSNIDIQAER